MQQEGREGRVILAVKVLSVPRRAGDLEIVAYGLWMLDICAMTSAGEVAVFGNRDIDATDSHVLDPRTAAFLIACRRPVAGCNVFVHQLIHVAVDFAEFPALIRAARNQHAVLAAALDRAPPVLDIHHSFSAVLRAVARATLDVSEMRVLLATFGGAGLETSWKRKALVGRRTVRVARMGEGQKRCQALP